MLESLKKQGISCRLLRSTAEVEGQPAFLESGLSRNIANTSS